MMKLDERATLKRIVCMLCSIGTLAGYSFLVAGTGGYLFGEGRPLTAAAGAAAGTMMAVIAIKIWQSYLRDLEELSRRERADAEEKRG